MAIAYLIVGWVLIQIADVTAEPLRLPDWSDTLVIWLVGLGFPVAVILAWVLDVSPTGIEVTAPAKEPEARTANEASIAVLPFVNTSGDAENEYFSDGLSEELLNLLARLQSIRVCSRTSSFALKGKDLDIPMIAAKLGVRYVLEGSVRRSGDRVRITAQLIDAANDSHLWSDTYDREMRDIFAVQDEIGRHILASLKLTLTDEEQRAISTNTSNVDALDYYMKGREQYHRTEHGHLDKALEYFKQAIRIDPDYALAWAGLTYVYVDTYWYKDKDQTWVDEADNTSRKAIELAPNLAESHAARGLALRVAEKFGEAEEEFKKAIEINPGLFEPIHFYAQMMSSLRRYDEGAALFEKAAIARPEDYQAMAIAVNMYENLGETDLAAKAARKTAERATRALELNPGDTRALYLGAHAWYRLGDEDRAVEWMDRAIRNDPKSSGTRYNAACLYAMMGDVDRALDHIEKAVDLGARNKRYYETDSDLGNIRDHPRFKALLERI